MKGGIYPLSGEVLAPSVSVMASQAFCGLPGTLEFFFLFLFSFFVAHFVRLNYGRRHWFARLLLKRRFFVCGHLVGCVLLYNYGLVGLAAFIMLWEYVCYKAWCNLSFERVWWR